MESLSKMVKNMGTNWRNWSLHKHNHLLVKAAVSILLVGVAFRLLFVHSSVPEAPFVQKPAIPTPPVVENVPEIRDPIPEQGEQIWKPRVVSVFFTVLEIRFSGGKVPC